MAKTDERIDDSRRDVIAAHDGAGMVDALCAGNGDQRFIVEAGRGAEKGGGNRNRLAGDEEGDGGGDVRGAGEGRHRLAACLFAGGIEQRCKKFGELPKLRFSRVLEFLEARHRGHQNHILSAHCLRPFKFTVPVHG